MTDLPLRLVYAANVIVAGTCGAISLFAPAAAARTIFHNAAFAGPALRVVGAFWLAITVVSALGLWRPHAMAAVFLIQLLYKGSWLAVEAIPHMFTRKARDFPTEMAWFFLAWALVLPWIVPWSELFPAAAR